MNRNNRRRTQRRKGTSGWKLGTWNCKSLNFIGSTRILADVLKDRGFGIVALQEVCWKGSMVRTFRGNHTISGITDDDKDAFYAQLEREYDSCPSHDVNIIIGDLNAQVGQEEEFRPTIGKFSAHRLTNENGLRLIDFAASKNMAIRSTYFQHSLPYRYTWRSPQQTESQIDHVLIDGRHFSDIIDVRTYRGANIDSDHYLVMVKLRPKLFVVKVKMNRSQTSNFQEHGSGELNIRLG